MKTAKSNNFDIVEWKGIDYDIRYCPDLENPDVMLTIGTETLEEVLDQDSTWPSTRESAIALDETFFGYVDDDILRNASDEEFAEYVYETLF